MLLVLVYFLEHSYTLRFPAENQMKIRLVELTGGKRLLITRESARVVGTRLETAGIQTGDEIVLDFEGISGLTPSYLDELLNIVDSLIAEDAMRVRITLIHPPTRLSAKFTAVGRGHGYCVNEVADDAWELVKAA